jgi:hypothetical protein
MVAPKVVATVGQWAVAAAVGPWAAVALVAVLALLFGFIVVMVRSAKSNMTVRIGRILEVRRGPLDSCSHLEQSQRDPKSRPAIVDRAPSGRRPIDTRDPSAGPRTAQQEPTRRSRRSA